MLLPAAIPLAFLGVFFVYPVVTILGRGLWADGGLDLTPIGDVFTDPGLRHVVWFTLVQAGLSTVLTLAIGLSGAYLFARVSFPGRGFLHAAVTVPFVLPTVVVGSAFLALLGGHGPVAFLGLNGTLGAILIAHVFFNYAVVVRTVGGFWSHLDPRREEAARVLGAGRVRTFWHVTLPALRPAIAAATAIVFLFTFTSFGIILILGGPQRATIETEIYRQTAVLLDLRTAAALTIVQLVAVVVLLGLTGFAGGRRALDLRAAATTRRRPRSAGGRAFVIVNLVVMAGLLGAPLGLLVQRSFATPDGPSLGFYRALGDLGADSVFIVPPIEAVRNSIEFALATTVISLVVGGLASVVIVAREQRGNRLARSLDGVLALPLGVSAVTVGFGFLIALDSPPLNLRTSWWLIPIAHSLIAVPFVIRTMSPLLRAIDPRLREAAAVLGASPARVWREIDLRIGGRAAGIAAGFAFAISLGEFGATAFIVRPDRPTLPVVIYRLLGRPGPTPFGAAMAASVILIALTLTAVVVIERFRVPGAGEF
ncbi:MAG TPA: iron ABC transporter permease [Acidimicrobiia bacterium]|nr:iron ABC transporter permease [Acidimicrobiia bacterium]